MADGPIVSLSSAVAVLLSHNIPQLELALLHLGPGRIKHTIADAVQAWLEGLCASLCSIAQVRQLVGHHVPNNQVEAVVHLQEGGQHDCKAWQDLRQC